jgi:hypothetical protein
MLEPFTYQAIDLNITAEDIDTMAAEILAVPESAWIFNEYRNCDILSIYDKDFNWTAAGNACTHLKHVYTTKIKPIMSAKGKIHILKTKEGDHIPTHIDCQEQEIPDLNHKFRIALKGKIDSLYFVDENDNKIYVPKEYRTYLINGGHPHGLDAAEEKITLCLGAPWKGEDSYNNIIHRMNVKLPSIKREWL